MAQHARLAAVRFGLAAGILSAGTMLLLSVFGRIGVYEGAVQAMQDWHLFYDLSAVGTIAGMVEAAVVGFIFAWALAWVYNRLPSTQGTA